MPDLGVQGLPPPRSSPVSGPSTHAPVKDGHVHKLVLSPDTAQGTWDGRDRDKVLNLRSLT